jgi:hypothetical protein
VKEAELNLCGQEGGFKPCTLSWAAAEGRRRVTSPYSPPLEEVEPEFVTEPASARITARITARPRVGLADFRPLLQAELIL